MQLCSIFSKCYLLNVLLYFCNLKNKQEREKKALWRLRNFDKDIFFVGSISKGNMHFQTYVLILVNVALEGQCICKVTC